jgi:hypothetical protein
MKLDKEFKDIVFNDNISEYLVMASAAGWYVGQICDMDNCIQPYDRYTDYMTLEDARKALKGFNQDQDKEYNGQVEIRFHGKEYNYDKTV